MLIVKTIAADIYISDEEAEQVGGDLYRNPETGKYKVEFVCLDLYFTIRLTISVGSRSSIVCIV